MIRILTIAEGLLYSVFVVSFLLLAFVAVAGAETVSKSFYNANGSFAGSSTQRGNAGSYYDGAGRFSGSSVQHGKWTTYYDHQGRFSGSTITQEPRR